MKSKFQILLDHIKHWLIILLIILVVLGVIFAWGAYEHAIWQECLTWHSWFYCLRVLS